jgi:hypothetical protein
MTLILADRWPMKTISSGGLIEKDEELREGLERGESDRGGTRDLGQQIRRLSSQKSRTPRR